MKARATTKLGCRKQHDGEGVAEFISALQQLAIAAKAFPQSDGIAQENIMEHLKKGLRCPFVQNHVNRR